MTREDNLLQFETRRHFFSRCGVGLGQDRPGVAARRAAAVGEPAKPRIQRAKPRTSRPRSRTSSTSSWRAARASSSCSTTSRHCSSTTPQPMPESLLKGKRFAFMDTFAKEPPKLLGTRRKFKQHGKSGSLGFGVLPHIGERCRRHRAWPVVVHRQLQSRAGEAVS